MTPPTEPDRTEGLELLSVATEPEPRAPASSFFFEPVLQETQASSTYLRLEVGAVRTTDFDDNGHDVEFDTGTLFGVAIGQRVNSWANKIAFDLELEGVWDTQNVNDNATFSALDRVNVGALFLNGVFDFPIAERMSLYAGAGIGAAWVDPDTQNNFDADDGPFLAWQARAGLQWHFSGGTALDIGYRFMNIDDVELDQNGAVGSSFDLETTQQALELGLTFGI
jgi:opacity protein-like surface antigen